MSIEQHEGSVFLAGKWESAPATRTVRAPWDGAEVGVVGEAGASLIEAAVAKAEAVARSLAARPSHEKRAFCAALARSVLEHKEPLASLIAREAGKPIALARAEVDRASATFALGAEESMRLGGEVLSLDVSKATEGFVGAWQRVAAGPVLAITPFNFPLNLAVHKLAPAFALGAPVVLKPPPQAPLTALYLAELARQAGAPEGQLSVVPCGNALAEAMVRDARFAVVSFTGSARVGWHLKTLAPRARVSLELGGNAAVILAPDAADLLDRAIDRVVFASYAYAGQVCIKTQRVFVPRAMKDLFLEKLLEKVRTIAVRSPLDEGALCASLIDESNASRVCSWVEEACERGAKVLLGGEREGNRVSPAVVIDAPEGTRLVDEELFGPVLLVETYDHFEEALERIDRGKYGLQTGLFTNDLRCVRQAFARLRVGALIVNEGSSFRVDVMPYGGVKESGLGREGVRYAIDEMSEKKLLVVRT